MNNVASVCLLSLSVAVTGCDQLATQSATTAPNAAQAALAKTTDNQWFVETAAAVQQTNEQVQRVATQRGSAKNIILFVGDGMGVSTVTAARIFDGQKKGLLGEENSLSFGRFPFVGLSKTYNVDAQTPDSAGTMTALISGVKTDAGTIGVDENVVRGDCSSVAGSQVFTALELAEIAGLATGIVSTARITHATPAATYAKSADRDWENNSKLPAAAVAAGCEDIASQLVNFKANLDARYGGLNSNGLEVVLGGGRREFLPNQPEANSRDADSPIEGDRTDGRNLVQEWKAAYPTGVYVDNQAAFDAVNSDTTTQLFGLFSESHMRYEADRSKDIAGEP